MKNYLFLVLGCLSILTTGCGRNRQCNDVVKETYIHKYGVHVAKNDWEEQGKAGTVILQKKDGVTVTQTFEEGVLHGEVTTSFPHSSLIQQSEKYDQGVLKSTRFNFPNGLAKREEIYENNGQITVTEWYEDGSPLLVEHYNRGKLIAGEYYTTGNCVDAKVQEGFGTRLVRSISGELLAKDTIQNGELIEKTTFYANGEPSSVVPYVNGMIHGVRLTYQEGGLPQTIEQWEHGTLEGLTLVYQNGEKIAEIPYFQGMKHGTERRFRDGTLVAEEISWVCDVQHGPKTLYIDGENRTEWYHEGELVSRSTYERMNMPY